MIQTDKEREEQKTGRLPHPTIKGIAKMSAIALMAAALIAYPYQIPDTESYFTDEATSRTVKLNIIEKQPSGGGSPGRGPSTDSSGGSNTNGSDTGYGEADPEREPGNTGDGGFVNDGSGDAGDSSGDTGSGDNDSSSGDSDSGSGSLDSGGSGDGGDSGGSSSKGDRCSDGGSDKGSGGSSSDGGSSSE